MEFFGESNFKSAPESESPIVAEVKGVNRVTEEGKIENSEAVAEKNPTLTQFKEYIANHADEVEAELRGGKKLYRIFHEKFYGYDIDHPKYNDADPATQELTQYYNEGIKGLGEICKEKSAHSRGKNGFIAHNDQHWLRVGINGGATPVAGEVVSVREDNVGQFYLNLSPEGIDVFCNDAMRMFEKSSVKATISIPSTGGAETFNRLGKVIIHFREAQEKEALKILRKLHSRNLKLFQDAGTPKFTAPVSDSKGKVMTGIGFGESPSQELVIPSQSFGELRCKILAKVYEDAKSAGVSVSDPSFDASDSFQKACESFRVDASNPAFNKGDQVRFFDLKKFSQFLEENQGSRKEKGKKKKEKRSVEEEEIEKEVEQMSGEKRKGLARGLADISYLTKEWTTKGLRNVLSRNAKKFEQNSVLQRFLTAMAERYDVQAKHAESRRKQLEMGKLEKMGSVASLAGWVVKIGRVAYDLNYANPLRHLMAASLFIGASAGIAKETRLKNEEVKDKTRIHDIDKAAEKAWVLYQAAEKEAVGEKVSTSTLDKAYLGLINQDVFERLKQKPAAGTTRGVMQRLAALHTNRRLDRVNTKINNIDFNKKLSPEEKKAKVDKLLRKQEKFLKDVDRIVTQAGTIDLISYGARMVEGGAKVVSTAMVFETLGKMMSHLTNLSFDSDYFTDRSEGGVSRKTHTLPKSKTLTQAEEWVKRGETDVAPEVGSSANPINPSEIVPGPEVEQSAIPSSSTGTLPPRLEAEIIPTENLPSAYESVKIEDSLWKNIGHQLDTTVIPLNFFSLSEAEHTRAIAEIVKLIEADPEKFGLPKDIDLNHLPAGQKINLSPIWENESALRRVFYKSTNLTPEQIENIIKNNRENLSRLRSGLDIEKVLEKEVQGSKPENTLDKGEQIFNKENESIAPAGGESSGSEGEKILLEEEKRGSSSILPREEILERVTAIAASERYQKVLENLGFVTPEARQAWSDLNHNTIDSIINHTESLSPKEGRAAVSQFWNTADAPVAMDELRRYVELKKTALLGFVDQDGVKLDEAAIRHLTLDQFMNRLGRIGGTEINS